MERNGTKNQSNPNEPNRSTGVRLVPQSNLVEQGLFFVSSIKFVYRTQSNSMDAISSILFGRKTKWYTKLISINSGVLPLKCLYYELLANLMFEIRHRNAAGNIQDFFEDIFYIHSYNSPSSVLNNFHTQSSRLSIQVYSFSRIGTKIWNETPLSVF